MTATRYRRPRPAAAADKPPYRVPTMAEIRALPWNGLTVASTFAGGGGSSTGYRMAGYRVLWANEITPEGRETYAANAAPHTVVDGRDVRDVKATEILEATGLAEGELDVFDGSPPCGRFSTAGKRSEGWGTDGDEDLFFEYARLLRGLAPRAFVAENVTGLVRGVARGYFKEILRELSSCGYRVEARVLDASWLGVPQARQRIIFVGAREDLGAAPAFPEPLPYQYSVRDALPWIDRQAQALGFGGVESGRWAEADRPSPTIGASTSSGNGHWPPSYVKDRPAGRFVHDTSGLFSGGDVTDKPMPTFTTQSAHYQRVGAGGSAVDPETGQDLTIRVRNGRDVAGARKLTLRELRALGGFPPDFVLCGSYGDRWERVGMAVPPVMMAAIASAVRDRVLGGPRP